MSVNFSREKPSFILAIQVFYDFQHLAVLYYWFVVKLFHLGLNKCSYSLVHINVNMVEKHEKYNNRNKLSFK